MQENQFKDSNGEVWSLHITVLEYMAIKKEHNIDIGNIFDEKSNWIQEMIAQEDMEVFLGILGCLTDKEREKRNMTMEDFYGSLGGDVLAEAANAMIEAIINFTPAHKRGSLRKVVDSTKTTLNKVGEKVEVMMEKEMETLDEQIDKVLNGD
jgi:hypothetical protein